MYSFIITFPIVMTHPSVLSQCRDTVKRTVPGARWRRLSRHAFLPHDDVRFRSRIRSQHARQPHELRKFGGVIVRSCTWIDASTTWPIA